MVDKKLSEDYYERLGISVESEPGEIKAAFRKLAFKFHPDRNPDDEACIEIMKRLNEAYAVLSNSSKRAEYDALRRQFGNGARARFRHKYSEHDIFNGSDIDEILANLGQMLAKNDFDAEGKSKLFYWNMDLHNENDDFKAGHLLLSQYHEKLASQNDTELSDIVWINNALAQTGGEYLYKSSRFDLEPLVVDIPAYLQDCAVIKIENLKTKTGDKTITLNLKVFVK